MKFWDASAVIPLLVLELQSEPVRHLYTGDPAVSVWWGTEVECVSALARRSRRRELTQGDFEDGHRRLSRLRTRWTEVPASQPVRETAPLPSSASTTSAQPMPSSSPLPPRPPTAPPPPSNSSASTSALAPPPESKGWQCSIPQPRIVLEHAAPFRYRIQTVNQTTALGLFPSGANHVATVGNRISGHPEGP